MKTKMITIPFDKERAKRIQAGEEEGKIITRDGCDVRIVCWDLQKEYFPIIAAITVDGDEDIHYRTENGMHYLHDHKETDGDLVLLVPEWMQFKEGDVIFGDSTGTELGKDEYEMWVGVLKSIRSLISFDLYTSYSYNGEDAGMCLFTQESCGAHSLRIATEEEKQQLIDVLKQSTDPRAKEYLKRFFGIEEKKECEFEFLQPVLVRGKEWNKWLYGEFTHKDGDLFFMKGGNGFSECIPYNEKTKHLLGTTDNWEE